MRLIETLDNASKVMNGAGHVAMDGASRVALRDWDSSDAAKAIVSP